MHRLKVKVEAVYKDEKECQATMSGENLRLRVTGAWMCPQRRGVTEGAGL